MLQVGLYLLKYTDYFIDNSYPVNVFGGIIGKTIHANANPNEYNTYLHVCCSLVIWNAEPINSLIRVSNISIVFPTTEK